MGMAEGAWLRQPAKGGNISACIAFAVQGAAPFRADCMRGSRCAGMPASGSGSPSSPGANSVKLPCTLRAVSISV